MLKSIRLQNFRLFKDLKVEGFERFNLIGGKNNVGKTALLEGLFIAAGPTKTDLTAIINGLRRLVTRLDAEGFWENYFHNFDINEPIMIKLIDENDFAQEFTISLEQSEIKKIVNDDLLDTSAGQSGKSENIEDYFLKYTYKDEKGKKYESRAEFIKGELQFEKQKSELLYMASIMSGGYQHDPDHDSQRLSRNIIKRKQEKILHAMKIIEPRMKQLQPLPLGKRSAVFCDLGFGDLVPIQISGLGTQRFLSMLLYIEESKDGVLLLDELENGIHHSIHEKIIENLFRFAEGFNVQIFATTHSYELTQAAHNVFKKIDGYPFRYYRLYESEGEIGVVDYDRELMETAIDEYMELR